MIKGYKKYWLPLVFAGLWTFGSTSQNFMWGIPREANGASCNSNLNNGNMYMYIFIYTSYLCVLFKLYILYYIDIIYIIYIYIVYIILYDTLYNRIMHYMLYNFIFHLWYIICEVLVYIVSSFVVLHYFFRQWVTRGVCFTACPMKSH